MHKTHILIVDTDCSVRRLLSGTLRSENYETDEAGTGEEALGKIASVAHHMVLVECNMPGMSGMDMYECVRASSSIPILMMSGRNVNENSVRALDAGADDFLRKPFQIPEVLARIRSVLRQTVPATTPRKLLEAGGIKVNMGTREVFVDGRSVRVTPREFALLVCLVRNANVSVPHRRILAEVWGADHKSLRQLLRVTVGQLRMKIEIDPAHPRYLITEPWHGYRLATSSMVSEADTGGRACTQAPTTNPDVRCA
jgi:two-component system KDP operon response regulator KdpE